MRSAALALALAACHTGAPEQNAMPRPAPEPAVVTFHTAGGDVAVQVEVADDGPELAQGLMNRSELEELAGMIFIFPNEEEHSFWMKNTLIPLDMIFVSAARTVVGIVANAEPLTLTSRTVGQRSKYVVEVNGGFATRHGVTTGTTLSFERIPGGD